jgi:type IV pilus assembly protein PilX
VTLIIMLLMLLVIMLLALSSVRTSTMNEKMAGNERDRDKAFQAAEAAVQNCLEQVNGNTFPMTSVLTPVAVGNPQYWEVATNWVATSTASTISHEVQFSGSSASTVGLAAYPRCIVETLGTGSYRVTGRAVGGSANTVVMLQATYSP